MFTILRKILFSLVCPFNTALVSRVCVCVCASGLSEFGSHPSARGQYLIRCWEFLKHQGVFISLCSFCVWQFEVLQHTPRHYPFYPFCLVYFIFLLFPLLFVPLLCCCVYVLVRVICDRMCTYFCVCVCVCVYLCSFLNVCLYMCIYVCVCVCVCLASSVDYSSFADRCSSWIEQLKLKAHTIRRGSVKTSRSTHANSLTHTIT